MPDDRVTITPSTKVAALLDSYPQLEDVLIGIAPPFKKLKNPILRRSVAKVASLRQAAAVGRLPVEELVNKLRDAVGQEPIAPSEVAEPEDSVARASDVLPSRFSEPGLAPASRSTCAISLWPQAAAIISAVLPAALFSSGSAPCFSSTRTASKPPRAVAWLITGAPQRSRVSASAPASSASDRASTSPRATMAERSACWSGISSDTL